VIALPCTLQSAVSAFFTRVANFDIGSAWIGGNNLQDDGTWRWSDGKPFTYANWTPGKSFFELVVKHV
jgi:hypothetical protein